MNIYFSCSITGGRQDQHMYKAIVDHLQAEGHEIPTAILASPNVMEEEIVVAPGDVYQRDVAWVEGCQALIAEVSTPSHGVGYEIALALCLNKPVLCLYQDGKKVSKMLTGNTHPNFTIHTYHTPDEAISFIREFLS
jgi:nucleoside 2-deoxyribosyltransferase